MTPVDRDGARVPSYAISPEGPNDTNGGDRINAHVSWRFLRALCCPARIIAAVTPLLLILLGFVLLGDRLRGAADLRAPLSRRSTARCDADGVDRRGDRARRRTGSLCRHPRADRCRGRVRGRRPSTARPAPGPHPAAAGRTGWTTIDCARRGGRVRRPRRDWTPIAVDHAALDAGLVVIPRESVGTAADVADRVPAGTAPDDPGPTSGRSGLVGRARDRPGCPDARLDQRNGHDDGRARPAADPDHARARRGHAGHRRRRRSAAADRRDLVRGRGDRLTLGLAWADRRRRSPGPSRRRHRPRRRRSAAIRGAVAKGQASSASHSWRSASSSGSACSPSVVTLAYVRFSRGPEA